MHSSKSGPNFVLGPLTKRQNGGALVAEKWHVFNMGLMIWARGCELASCLFRSGEDGIGPILINFKFNPLIVTLIATQGHILHSCQRHNGIH
jgi:hypothetical protein